MRIIITLNNKVVSLRSPEGNNNILDTRAFQIVDMFSSFAACHVNMVAASHCSLQLLFSISFGRGQGSAAGAAEDHITCMLDA